MSEKGRRGFFASLLSGARALADELGADDDTPRFTPGASPPEVPGEAPRRKHGPPARVPRVHRPPGALPEAGFLAACTRCGACIDACPEDTLALSADGLPIAEPARSACALCPSTPCIAACEPGALVPTPPHAFRIGTARVMARLCLNAHPPQERRGQPGQPGAETSSMPAEPCDRCLDYCPVPGAIAVGDERSVPRVDPAVCTGCGLCAMACPALPRAIALD